MIFVSNVELGGLDIFWYCWNFPKIERWGCGFSYGIPFQYIFKLLWIMNYMYLILTFFQFQNGFSSIKNFSQYWRAADMLWLLSTGYRTYCHFITNIIWWGIFLLTNKISKLKVSYRLKVCTFVVVMAFESSWFH